MTNELNQFSIIHSRQAISNDRHNINSFQKYNNDVCERSLLHTLLYVRSGNLAPSPNLWLTTLYGS